jgi:hypothetical protein
VAAPALAPPEASAVAREPLESLLPLHLLLRLHTPLHRCIQLLLLSLRRRLLLLQQHRILSPLRRSRHLCAHHWCSLQLRPPSPLTRRTTHIHIPDRQRIARKIRNRTHRRSPVHHWLHRNRRSLLAPLSRHRCKSNSRHHNALRNHLSHRRHPHFIGCVP